MANFYKVAWIERAVKLTRSNGTSFWFKDALTSALKRDVVDAYYDAAALADILKSRMEQALGTEPEA